MSKFSTAVLIRSLHDGIAETLFPGLERIQRHLRPRLQLLPVMPLPVFHELMRCKRGGYFSER